MTDDPAAQISAKPTLRLYNTLTRRKEAFAPIDPANVRMYVCGPTVYDFAHIGNARPVIVFDLLFRLLRHLYGETPVTYVRNITDVDDKINARAARDFPGLPLNDAIGRVTAETEGQFHDDIRALGVLMPADVNLPGEHPRLIEPRATEHIADMRELIDRLVASGHAYVAEDNVLFNVPSMPDYGGLSRRPLGEMEAGARVDVAPYKRSALDFVLWKPSKPGEPAWPSPAGIAAPGRPGWHIECSAMSWKHLGEHFDIHGGGLDLIFPHHENEIAQTRCCFGTPAMANVWMHNGFLQVEGEKMSKSAGNFVTIRDVLTTDAFAGRDWSGDTLRLAMLRTPYRDPIDWTAASLIDAENVLNVWWRAAWRVAPAAAVPAEVVSALCDDLDTPRVIQAIHDLRKRGRLADLHGSLLFLGFPIRRFHTGQMSAAFSIVSSHRTELSGEASDLLVKRLAARAAKNWAESDRIRDELKAMGVQLKDNKDGTTTWEVVH